IIVSVPQPAPSAIPDNSTAPDFYESSDISGIVNNTTFEVIPPELSYLPEMKTTDEAGETPIVIENRSENSAHGYTVIAYAGHGGAIFPEGMVEVMAGGDITFIITPYENHKIDYLLVDGSNVSVSSEYQFVNITKDHTIIAGFA
ncbi:MAG TPA: hypothetical protein PKX11_08090, partial [Methanospirillum sp.]|nr:hypothetical protein [Methanospirillum sp.]